jgi:glycosyltransferase involved in cell wall biosynthesis
LGLAGRVAVREAVPKSEVPDVLQGGDIFLNTSAVDNMPRSVVEAMACGLCVVSTTVGGISNLIESRRTGMLVDPGDSQSMATAVCELVENAALASQVSAAGLERAKEHDWSRVMPLWKSLFQEVQRIGD